MVPLPRKFVSAKHATLSSREKLSAEKDSCNLAKC
uniref:Uncharacterized protein n=1 Tax=Arundo donax TaxID=35708 RepID=A0A0A9BQZ0_ARUDO